MKRILAAAASLTAVTVSTAAILTGSTPGSAGSSPIPAVQPITVPAIQLPLDSSYPTAEQDMRLQRADMVARRACLRGMGLDMSVPDTYTPGQVAGKHQRLFGLLDPVEGAAVGYHGWGDPSEADRAREADVASRQVPAPVLRALLGEDPGTGVRVAGPEGGCVGQAARQLAAHGGGWDSGFLDSAALGAGDRSREDSSLVAAMQRWSSCMADAGYEYPDPLAAIDDPKWATERASEAERAVAANDAVCKDRTDLIAVWTSVTAEQQRAAMVTQKDSLAKDATALRITLDNADRVLHLG